MGQRRGSPSDGALVGRDPPLPRGHAARSIHHAPVIACRNDSRALSERVLPAAVLLCSSAALRWRYPSATVGGAMAGSSLLPASSWASCCRCVTAASWCRRSPLPLELTTVERWPACPELVQREARPVAWFRHGRGQHHRCHEPRRSRSESVYGVIHPPQVALVGFGSVHNEAWPDDAVLTIRPTVHTSLAGDHRASDGLAGSRFLAQLQAIVNTIISEERERSTTNDPRTRSAESRQTSIRPAFRTTPRSVRRRTSIRWTC